MSDRKVASHTYPVWGPRAWLNWGTAQIVTSGVVVVIAIVLAWIGEIIAAVLLVAVAALLIAPSEAGIPMFDRAGIGLSYLWRRTLGRTRWERGDAGDDQVGWLAGTELHEFAVGGGAIGIVERDGQWMAGVRVAPLRNPALLSPEALDLQAERWAQLLTAVPDELVDRVQVLTVTRSGGGESLVADAASASGPGAAVTQAVAKRVAGQMRHTETVLMMRLRRKAGNELYARDGVGAVGSTLYQVITASVKNLGLDELRIELLGKHDITTLVSRILHPASAADALLRPPATLDTVKRFTERFTSVELDDALHRVMWVWQWPQRPVGAGWLQPILTGSDRVVSVVVSVEDRAGYARKLDGQFRRAEVSLATSTHAKHRKMATRDAANRRLEEMTAGHIPVRAQITVGVTGRSGDELAAATSELRTDAGPAHSRVAVWEGRQERAVSWLLPFCEGLGGGAYT